MMTTVVVFGGAGFLGRRVVHRLTTEGMTVRVAVRHPDPARIELRSKGFDRVTVVPADGRPKVTILVLVRIVIASDSGDGNNNLFGFGRKTHWFGIAASN
jgi:nucleoside-diphosphate-sugar epimerase